MPNPNLWFKVQFKSAQNDELSKKFYEGYWKGYVAYHDENIDRAAKGNHHNVRLSWVDDYNLDVILEPLDNPLEHPVTYTLPAVNTVSSVAASSDPPLPPPPPSPRRF